MTALFLTIPQRVNSNLIIKNHEYELYVKIMSYCFPFSQGKEWNQMKLTEFANKLMPVAIMCPVNVEITDNEGYLVASVINDEVIYNTSDDFTVVVWTEDEHKYFIIMGRTDLNISLKGTDEGTMDCIVSVLSDGEKRSESVACYEDVELYDGKEMTIKINTEQSQQVESLSIIGDIPEIIEPVYSKSSYLYGDINNDNIVDATDASLVLVEYTNISTGFILELTENQQRAADVNFDGIIDSTDASKILAYYAMASVGGNPTWD